MKTGINGRTGVIACVLLAAGIVGCDGGPRTHPVTGKVAVDGGDVAALAGSHIDAEHAEDPSIRASGEIQPDGSFTLETLHTGTIRRGARPGSYRVRIVLNDDDPASRKRASRAVAPRHLSFDSSGLSLQVPAESNPVVKIAAR